MPHVNAVEPRPGDPRITPALISEHGLTTEEYSASSRCSAASRRSPSSASSARCGVSTARTSIRGRCCKSLPTTAPYVLQGPGENAGVISIGDGLAVAFKIESHNHPSAVEPYQGAATGVGGILRDVFTMGARPIAMLNSLRFGSLDSARVRYLFAGVVKGIGDYGNCVGIPTVAGEVAFDPSYEGNPLVNAMCVGLMHEHELIRAVAQGVGNPIIAVGARTGRDGIHGASFASEDLSGAERGEAPARAGRRSVHREAAARGEPRADSKRRHRRDSGHGRGGTHVVVGRDGGARRRRRHDRHDSKVPVREEGMTPYEILLSESQERMLVVAKRGREREVARILEKWDLTAAVIGEVIAEPVYRVTEGDRVVAEFPGMRLVTDCPMYTPEARESAEVAALRARNVTRCPSAPRSAIPRGRSSSCCRRRRSPRRRGSIASTTRRCARTRSLARAATPRSFACAAPIARSRCKTDCNGRYVYLDPRVGTQIAVSEAARNVACTGARPMAITNNSNFGNPQAARGLLPTARSGARHGARRARRSARRSRAATSRSTTRIPAAPSIRRR